MTLTTDTTPVPSLIDILYAHSGATPPEFIGLPRNGKMTYAEDIHLAHSLYDMMTHDRYGETTVFGLPSYMAEFEDTDPLEITPAQTFQSKLMRNMHRTARERAGKSLANQTLTVAYHVRSAAYDTFMLHANEAGWLCPEQEQKVHESVQQGGFADFKTMRTLLVKEPIETIPMIDAVANKIWQMFTLGEACHKHTARCDAEKFGQKLIDTIEDADPVINDPSRQEREQFTQMQRWFGENKGLNAPQMVLKAEPGMTYPF